MCACAPASLAGGLCPHYRYYLYAEKWLGLFSSAASPAGKCVVPVTRSPVLVSNSVCMYFLLFAFYIKCTSTTSVYNTQAGPGGRKIPVSGILRPPGPARISPVGQAITRPTF